MLRFQIPNSKFQIPNKKGQLNLGFIIAVLLLIVLIISATTWVLDLLPTIKHDAEMNSLEPQAAVISRLLIEDTGWPSDWTSSNVERVGLLHHNSYSNKSILGQLNSTKIDYVNSISYSTIAHQLGLGNDTSFRLRADNGTVFLDINNTLPGSSSSVYVLKRVLSVDNTGFANVTLEVWK